MQNGIELFGEHFFEITSLLISVAALIYAALAFRVARQAVGAAKESDLIALKMKAQDGRAKAERSFTSLQSACRNVRKKWDVHHQAHYPLFGHQNVRQEDTRHIIEIERKGQDLLKPLTLSQAALKTMKPAALEDYIEQTDVAARQIDKLGFRLSAPKQFSA
jgi:hypothetical protein